MSNPETSSPQTNFFDSDDVKVKCVWQRFEEKHQSILRSQPKLKNYFRMTSNQPEQLERGLFCIYSHNIVIFKNEGDQYPDSVLDILHGKLRFIKPSEENPEHGFSITKNRSQYCFYSSERRIVDRWYEALKNMCVLSSFHEDYKAVKMIGRGSFAKVYLVECKASGKSFAVKGFTKDAVSAKANGKTSLLNEMFIMRTVEHENLIKLFEVYETDQSIYLVLELIEGKSLYEFLRKPNFRQEVSQVRIINIMRSLLDALMYLASQGIMHRDLKPDNILLDANEKVKIVDFGLATLIDLPTYIFKKCGTPGYIAPEVFKYNETDVATHYSEKCDLFSTGCLFYYLLFNTRLFGGPTANDILKSNKAYGPEFPALVTIQVELNDPKSRIPKDGLNLLVSLLESDPLKRPSAAEALNSSYFVPIPMGMQKVFGAANEFYISAMSKHTLQDNSSPGLPRRSVFAAGGQNLSPMIPPRYSISDKESPLMKERYIEDNSLYLDVGKPELNGRTSTLTPGSSRNSILVPNRRDSVNSITSPSRFAGKTMEKVRRSPKKTLSSTLGNNNNLLKSAIYMNLQKVACEEQKIEETVDGEGAEQIAEQAQEEHKISLQTQEADSDESKRLDSELIPMYEKRDPKSSQYKGRKFHPFASGNLIIPKNELAGSVRSPY